MIIEDNELYEIDKIRHLYISADGETDIEYVDKNGDEKDKWILDNQILKLFEIKDKEIERLNNIIYTTLEYVDREEINSTGTPYIYTERGKHIKELLEGERTFNSVWQENKRLNNIINEFETLIKHEITESIFEDNYGRVDAMEYCLATLRELKGEDKE